MGDCYLAWNHCSFEHEFESLCKDKGYVVVDLSYHHNYKEEVMRELRKDSSPTSLSVRLAPDMMISKEGKTIFCELKTGRSKDIMRVEAYQLMCNIIKERFLFTPCLYIYRGGFSDNRVIACYSSNIICNELVIPDKEKNKQIEPIIKQFFNCPT